MPDPEPLVDFAAPAARLRRLLPVLAVLAVVAAGVDAQRSGLTLGLVLRWGTVLALAALLSLALLTAVHALGGADRAQRRGERLAGDDVGLLPGRGDDRPEGG
jgi:hypothetical protein